MKTAESCAGKHMLPIMIENEDMRGDSLALWLAPRWTAGHCWRKTRHELSSKCSAKLRAWQKS